MRKNSIDKQTKMFAMLDRWQQSGISQRRCCKEHGISLSKFKYWYRKWKSNANEDSRAGFLEIDHQGPSAILLEKVSMHFPNGLRLDFESGVDPLILMTIVKQF